MGDLYAGCLCGFVQTVVGHPFDTAKVLLQTASISKSAQRRPVSRSKVTLSTLYRGVTYPFLFNGFFGAVTFGCNDHLRRQPAFANNYQTGYVTGALGAVLTTPVDLQKVRAQSVSCVKPTSTGKRTLGNDLATSNLRSFLFRGFVPTFHRESIGSSIYFGTYASLQEQRGSNPLLHGGLSGVLSWLVTYPIDTVKTRVQAGRADSMLPALRQGNLWGGIVPCLIRSFLVNACGFYAYEWFKK